MICSGITFAKSASSSSAKIFAIEVLDARYHLDLRQPAWVGIACYVDANAGVGARTCRGVVRWLAPASLAFSARSGSGMRAESNTTADSPSKGRGVKARRRFFRGCLISSYDTLRSAAWMAGEIRT